MAGRSGNFNGKSSCYSIRVYQKVQGIAHVRGELVFPYCFSVCLLFQIGDLKPDTSYVFLVRAENSHGLSVPSPVSEVARTLGADRRSVPQYELDEARVRLGTKVVQLRDVQPISSTSVRLIWDVSCLQGYDAVCILTYGEQYTFASSAVVHIFITM